MTVLVSIWNHGPNGWGFHPGAEPRGADANFWRIIVEEWLRLREGWNNLRSEELCEKAIAIIPLANGTTISWPVRSVGTDGRPATFVYSIHVSNSVSLKILDFKTLRKKFSNQTWLESFHGFQFDKEELPILAPSDAKDWGSKFMQVVGTDVSKIPEIRIGGGIGVYDAAVACWALRSSSNRAETALVTMLPSSQPLKNSPFSKSLFREIKHLVWSLVEDEVVSELHDGSPDQLRIAAESWKEGPIDFLNKVEALCSGHDLTWSAAAGILLHDKGLEHCLSLIALMRARLESGQRSNALLDLSTLLAAGEMNAIESWCLITTRLDVSTSGFSVDELRGLGQYGGIETVLSFLTHAPSSPLKIRLQAIQHLQETMQVLPDNRIIESFNVENSNEIDTVLEEFVKIHQRSPRLCWNLLHKITDGNETSKNKRTRIATILQASTDKTTPYLEGELDLILDHEITSVKDIGITKALIANGTVNGITSSSLFSDLVRAHGRFLEPDAQGLLVSSVESTCHAVRSHSSPSDCSNFLSSLYSNYANNIYRASVKQLAKIEGINVGHGAHEWQNEYFSKLSSKEFLQSTNDFSKYPAEWIEKVLVKASRKWTLPRWNPGKTALERGSKSTISLLRLTAEIIEKPSLKDRGRFYLQWVLFALAMFGVAAIINDILALGYTWTSTLERFLSEPESNIYKRYADSVAGVIVVVSSGFFGIRLRKTRTSFCNEFNNLR